ncbi:hypothetical protein [Oricola thermophila]|uniref:Uncharacterized protein n=1 Tax=Oricola thermophila TaxID=2742145 RepID=A0A6N1VDK8_9HYPH|nr:hypothetical protein [Oricola thermophila]QKV17695.1 hypothetical protein HTY61_04030 [Oricola thermophila]
MLTRPVRSSGIGIRKSDQIPGQLLVVCGEEDDAQNKVELICAAHNLIVADPTERIGLRTAFELPDDPLDPKGKLGDIFKSSGIFELFVSSMEFPLAVALAVGAWPDKSLVYAIHKLSKSLEMESVTAWSIEPRFGQVFEKHSALYSDHVNTSAAINLAFSAIEELKLEIRSSREHPRFTNNKSGNWNPEVLEDIIKRLRVAGIEPEERISWAVRGEKSKIEDEMKPSLGEPAAYNDGKIVRDKSLTIPEALHYCSYIRNFMTAHGLSAEAKFLGPYELFNVQNLARRLILSKAALWMKDTDDLLKSLEK